MANDDSTLSPARREPHARPLLSVVVPCYNEEAIISEMHCHLTAVLGEIPAIDFEIIYVDDGSRDATLERLRGLQRADPRVRIISLSRNFGQQMAITAGLAEAAGDAVAIMDADLQDPPEVILDMLELWRRGVDVAYGVRSGREGETVFKRWTSKVFYRLMSLISDTPIPLDAGDFRLMDRKVVNAFLAMRERDRFIRGMVPWVGFRQEPILYHRRARAAGETKWPFKMMLHLAADGIVSFSFFPLHLATWVGFSAAGLAILGIVYAVFIRIFTDTWITGWATLFIVILFLGGVQLMLIGVLGEYLGRIYAEVKRRPLYLVKERLGFTPIDRPAPTSRRTVHEAPGDESHGGATAETADRPDGGRPA